MLLSINPINNKNQSISSNQLCNDKLYFSLKFAGNAQYVCVSVCVKVCGCLRLPQMFPVYQIILSSISVLMGMGQNYGYKI